jgi:hypothetical protein
VAQRKTLTEQQVEILRWISEGCPAGVMEGDAHRVSAAALRRRGFVTTSGRGSTWSAEVTAVGREYLAKVDSDDPPMARQANVSVTQQLVDDVIAGGGTLRVPRRRWQDPDGIDYENRALLAERYGKVPTGKRLEVVPLEDELEIRLLDAPGEPGRAELVDIEIPKKVPRYHEAARRFRDDKARHEVSRVQLQRAVVIIHVIAIEALRRGWPVSSIGGGLKITADGHDFCLELQEKGVKPRGRWEEEVERYRSVPRDSYFYRDREIPSGPYDAGATGELNLQLGVERSWIFRGRQSRWGDRTSWKLEERLSHVFREIEERVVKADRVAEEERVASEKRAEEAQRAAEERERQWHSLMEQARKRLVESQRAAVLRSQEQAWREAERLREYCDAMEAAHGEHPDSADWIAWARGFAARLDPLSERLSMPEPPEETPEALQEHLPKGWSVHGPEYGRAHIPAYRRFG